MNTVVPLWEKAGIPNLEQLIQLAEIGSMKEREARAIIEEIRSVVSKWKHFAALAAVSSKSQKIIQEAINKIFKAVFVTQQETTLA